MFLKQECEECLSSGENLTKQLGSIQEEVAQDYSDSGSNAYSDAPENNKDLENANESQILPSEDLENSQSVSDTEGIDPSDTDSHKALEVCTGVENVMKVFR